jgi:predicted SnoaL-like aldol condensation-catalyzing enzyme
LRLFDRGATSATVVRQFYTAVNTAIATGDVSAVHRVVAPHFVEHNRLPGQRPGREGLEDTLGALHAVNPDMQVVPDTIVADDKQVMARVAVVGIAGAASSSGTVVTGPSIPWGPVDVFRVVDGKIVERWSDTDGMTMVRPLANASVDLSTPSPRVMTLERLHIDAGDHWTALALGPRLLYSKPVPYESLWNHHSLRRRYAEPRPCVRRQGNHKSYPCPSASPWLCRPARRWRQRMLARE